MLKNIMVKTMRIKSIKLKNYRQYKDTTIEFPPFDEQKSFIIIIGGTGAGKTNLLNAITWCLYAVEYNIRDKDKALPLINLMAFEELEEGESTEVSVEIRMEGDKSEILIFNRRMIYKKINGKPVKISDYNSTAPDGSTFTLIRQIGKDMMPVHDPEFILNTLIPQSIEQYFFFDGERLNDYFKSGTTENVKDAVYRISQIGLLERLINHLEKRKEVFTRKIKNTSPDIKRIQEELEIFRKSLETQKELLREMINNKNEAEKEFKKCSDELRNFPKINVRQLEENRRNLEKDLDSIEEKIMQLNKEKLSYMMKMAPMLALAMPLNKLDKLIKDRDEAGKIPPEYSKGFIDKLLKDGVCICGTDLRENEEAAMKIKKMMEKYDEINELSIMLIRLQGKINVLKSKAMSFNEQRLKINDTIKSYEELRKEKSKEIQNIEVQLKNIDIEKISELEENRKKWLDVRDKLNMEIGAKKQIIEQFQKTISKLERELDKEIQKDRAHKEILNIREFCDMAKAAAEELKNDIMIDIKNKIQEKTKEQFLSLIWKSDDWVDVIIDDDYNVSIIHKSGLQGIGSLSAGEGTVLAMSFMAALNIVSGFDVPIVIDTPLGRIAGEPRRKIAQNLPRFLQGKQVTMLVTDTEYTEEIRELLSDRVGKTFKIKFTETGFGGIAEVISIE